MSELLNKYITAHDRLITAMTQYYKLHERYLGNQNLSQTQDLRKVLKQMRLAIKEMEVTAMAHTKQARELRRIQKENKNDNINSNQ
ncbi:MAG: hypothetical protein WCP55_01425 [Lentisphaerota bacterium]